MECPLCFSRLSGNMESSSETWGMDSPFQPSIKDLDLSPVIPLADGRFVHKECIEAKQREILELEKRIQELQRSIQESEELLRKQESFFHRVAAFWDSRKSIDPDAVIEAIRIKKNNLALLTAQFGRLSQRLEAIFDFFLEYPPDWESRRAFVLARDGVCSNCGKSGSYRNKLHVHHVKQLGRGGTNRLDNLVLLCEKCHKEEHGVKKFGGEREENPPAIRERLIRINDAISNNQDVEFLYRKFEENHFKKRIITPYEIVNLNHRDGEGTTLCVRGFCKLRQAERTFAVKRMKALKIRD